MRQDEAGDLIVTRSVALMEAQTGQEMVALDLEKGTCYGFNATAYRIWQLIEQPKTLAELCAILSQEFEIDPEACQTEVGALLDELAEGGLVTLAAGSPTSGA